MLLTRVAENSADLSLAAAAIDARHQLGQLVGSGNPAGGPAFSQAAKIDQLDIEPPDARCFAEHVCLERACGIPGRLTTHCGIKRKNEPAPLALGGGGAERAQLFDKRLYFRFGRNRRRASLRLLAHGGNSTLKPRNLRVPATPSQMATWVLRCKAGRILGNMVWPCNGWSMTEYHSARAAARRLPFSESGRCSAFNRAITSSRAVTCDKFGRMPRVSSSRLSSAVSPRGKNSRETTPSPRHSPARHPRRLG